MHQIFWRLWKKRDHHQISSQLQMLLFLSNRKWLDCPYQNKWNKYFEDDENDKVTLQSHHYLHMLLFSSYRKWPNCPYRNKCNKYFEDDEIDQITLHFNIIADVIIFIQHEMTGSPYQNKCSKYSGHCEIDQITPTRIGTTNILVIVKMIKLPQILS